LCTRIVGRILDAVEMLCCSAKLSGSAMGFLEGNPVEIGSDADIWELELGLGQYLRKFVAT
jgi:hypothetical protein